MMKRKTNFRTILANVLNCDEAELKSRMSCAMDVIYHRNGWSYMVWYCRQGYVNIRKWKDGWKVGTELPMILDHQTGKKLNPINAYGRLIYREPWV